MLLSLMTEDKLARHPWLEKQGFPRSTRYCNDSNDLQMSSPGALWLGVRQRFQHGLRVAWYRDVVRPRILGTPPIAGTVDKRCEIHVFTSRKDWLNLVWALKSFYVASGRRYSLCIHEDGSLANGEVAALARHFPDARIIRRQEADARLAGVLAAFPRSLRFRNMNLLAPKLFDFAAFLESDRMGLFDSDLLFFAPPAAYLARVEDPDYRSNTFNADCNSSYTVDPQAVRNYTGVELVPLINTGLALVHRRSVRWDWTEEFLAIPGILNGHFWRIEQTLYALCSSRYGVELLPEDYAVNLEGGLGTRCFRHYIGAIRHLMYREGMARLVQDGFFDKIRAWY
jgi:hypothetical protein